MLQAAADERHIEAKVEKITDPARIMAYQVMATPAVAIDGKLVHSGGVPDRKQIDQWLGD
jgi:predicted thioredoxin/glutaredoxin